MKTILVTLQAIILTTILGLILSGCQPKSEKEPNTVSIRLLQTNDLHAYMLGYDYFRQQPSQRFGLSHTASLIAQARHEQPNALLFDNGDTIQGSPLGDWVVGQGLPFLEEHTHPVIDAMNYLGYHAAALGNHEFNYGLPFLHATLKGAKFPVLAANLFPHGQEAANWQNPVFTPYSIQTHRFVSNQGQPVELKIGVLGLVPPDIMRWDRVHLEGQIQARDMVATATHFIPEMRAAGVDLLVVLAHTGIRDYGHYEEGAEQTALYLAQIPGIDALMLGHQHQLLPGPHYANVAGVDATRGLIHGVPAVMAGQHGNHLGVIDLTLQQQNGNWQVIKQSIEVRAITEQQDQTLVSLLSEAHQQTITMLNTPLGQIASPISNYFARVLPNSAISWVNQAQSWYVEKLKAQGVLPDLPILSAAAPFRTGFNGPQDYTHLAAGDLTLGNVADLYVFPNTLVVIELTGQQVRDWLEMSARAFNTITHESDKEQALLANVPSYNFDMISGLSYDIDLTVPPRFDEFGQPISDNHRIQSLRYHGQNVTTEQRFLLATNNYRVSGGGHFPGATSAPIHYAGDAEIRQIIAEFTRQKAQEHSTAIEVSVKEQWQLRFPTAARVIFKSSGVEAAIAEAQHQDRLKLIQIDEHGFGYFQLQGTN